MVKSRGALGYTLVELLVVMAIVATLLSIVGPQYFRSLDIARDTVLRTTLQTMREAIDRYRGDTGRSPESLSQLVQAKYLREVPIDPITERSDTWSEVTSNCDVVRQSKECRALIDVRSGAPGVGVSGVEYAKW